MAILAKVSEAYTKLKADNADMQRTIKILELENTTLKEILSNKNRKAEAETEREKPETTKDSEKRFRDV